MRYINIMVFMLFSVTQVFSQNYEVGAYVGGANYIGDVGNTTYIKPTDIVFGGLFKWNRSTRHSYRFSLLYADIEGIDTESHDTRRQQRGYSFTNSILEASAGIEFTYFDYDPHAPDPQWTPYLYTGINFFRSDHLSLTELPFVPSGTPLPSTYELVERGTIWEFSIPMVLGYKQTLNSFLSAGIEIGARYTFTDNFDGSSPSEMDGVPPNNISGTPSDWGELDFGNPNTSDWYVFTGIYLTFNFGQKPCYTHL